MKFMLLLYGDETRWIDQPPEEAAAEMKLWEAFGQSLVDSGVWVAGEGLQPTPSATTVRIQDGAPVHTDGPFAETREQLGGFYLLDCKDADEALAWAAKVPDLGEGGSIEVRPVMDYEAYGSAAEPGAEAKQA
jgi:hypothetical protein